MRVVVGGLLVAGALLLLNPVAAYAEDPVDLHGAYVLDEAGVLDDTGAVTDALDTLYAERGTQLFVVYVETFEGAAGDQDWVNRSAELSGLGDSDVLLAIATVDRVVRWSVSESFPVSDDRLQSIYDDRVVPELKSGDWGGGAIAFAQGLSDAQAPSPVLPIALGVAGVAGGSALTVALVRRGRARRAAKAAAEADSAELERRAGAALVGLDDALKTSEQELGFAEAQFGKDQTTDFAAALAEATAMARQAFELRQKLDDAYPETPEQHRAMTLQLIDLAEKADAVLDAQADAFDALRELERNAPRVLDEVATAQAGLATRIDAAETRIAELGAAHPGSDLTAVSDVPAQARKLARFAATAVADARAELAKPSGEAAIAVRAAQQAVGQVEQLLASVDTLAETLAEQARQDARDAAALDTARGAAQSAVAAAQDYITTHRGAVGATARTRISEAQRRLDALAGLTAAAGLAEAQQVRSLAELALRVARSDVEDYQRPDHADYGEAYDEADGAGLGGILSDLFFGGSGSSGSGSSGGWSWGGSSGGSSWSSSRPSGFGGSSRRSSGSSRRSSSSRSSGGRRGGGGRF
ncbi:MAG TPA: TPM domain-containing protein [Pseudolysinimonas sp.]|nr:TPM domain-containing protein [Pseudolysinimonas sp.]